MSAYRKLNSPREAFSERGTGSSLCTSDKTRVCGDSEKTALGMALSGLMPVTEGPWPVRGRGGGLCSAHLLSVCPSRCVNIPNRPTAGDP